MSLSDRASAFAAFFAATGDGAAAARRAGYPASSAKQAAYRLLRNPAVQAKIKQIRETVRVVDADRAAAGGGGSGAPPLTGEIFRPGAPEPDRPEDEAVETILSREWVIGQLMRNARIAMGDMRVTVTKMVKVSGRNGQPDNFVAVQTEAFERDGAVANRALELLSKELDRMAKIGEDASPEARDETKPAVTRNPELARQIERFLTGVPSRQPSS